MSIKQISQQEIFNSLVATTNLRHEKYNSPGALFLQATCDPKQTFHLDSVEGQTKIAIFTKRYFCVRLEISNADLNGHFLKGLQLLGQHPLEAIIITVHSRKKGKELCFGNAPNGIYHTPTSSDFSLFIQSAEKVRVFLCSCSTGKRGAMAEKMARVAPKGMVFFGPNKPCQLDFFFPDRKKTFSLFQVTMLEPTKNLTQKYQRTSKGISTTQVRVKRNDLKEYFARANRKEGIFQFVMAYMYEKGILVKKSDLKFLHYLNECLEKTTPAALIELASFYLDHGFGEGNEHNLIKAANYCLIVHENYGPDYRLLKTTLCSFCRIIYGKALIYQDFKSIEILKDIAQRDYPFAHFFLGNLYFEGKGGAKLCYYEAIRHWFYASNQECEYSIQAYKNIITLLNNPEIELKIRKPLMQFFKDLNLYYRATLQAFP